MCLLAINQMPKLPWFDSRFAPGGDLGPIYGPRYMRTHSRALVGFMIVVIAYNLAAPPSMGWRSVPSFFCDGPFRRGVSPGVIWAANGSLEQLAATKF
jgi:hypothetical protein